MASTLTLLSLPPEIRYLIYNYCAREPGLGWRLRQDRSTVPLKPIATGDATLLYLAQVNQQLRAECLPSALAELRLVVGKPVEFANKYLGRLSVYHLTRLRHIALHFGHELSKEAACRRLPSLDLQTIYFQFMQVLSAYPEVATNLVSVKTTFWLRTVKQLHVLRGDQRYTFARYCPEIIMTLNQSHEKLGTDAPLYLAIPASEDEKLEVTILKLPKQGYDRIRQGHYILDRGCASCAPDLDMTKDSSGLRPVSSKIKHWSGDEVGIGLYTRDFDPWDDASKLQHVEGMPTNWRPLFHSHGSPPYWLQGMREYWRWKQPARTDSKKRKRVADNVVNILAWS